MSFGGGYGHINRMIRENSLRNEQRKERIKTFKKNGGVFSDSTMELEFEEVSNEKLEQLRQTYLKKLRKERIKNNLILLFSIIISIPLFILLVTGFFNKIL